MLGMHRSGTSALAGMLSLLGCATPATLIKGDKNNEKGYFESNAVGRLSDQILTEFGTVWSDWLPIDLDRLLPQKRSEFSKLIGQTITADFGEAPLFVLKEPRMCRMVPLWHSAIQKGGAKLHFVHTHRNPQEVAASLHVRDGFEPAYGYLLWLRHVLDAEHATRGGARVFTSYAQLIQNWQDVVDKLDTSLALPFPSDRQNATKKIDAFLSQKLKHNNDAAEQTLANQDLPRMLRDVFAVMERWVGSGEDPSDFAQLDACRAELDEHAKTFATLARPGQMALLDQQRLLSEVADHQKKEIQSSPDMDAAQTLRTAIAAKAKEVEVLSAALADRDRTQKEQEKTLRIWGLENDSLRAQVSTKKRLEALLHADVRARDKTIETMSRELQDLRAEASHLTSAAKDLRTTIADKEMDVARLLDIIRERDETLKQRDASLAALHGQLEARGAEIEALHANAAQRAEALHALQSEVTSHAETLNVLRKKNSKLSQRAADAEERSKGLMQSTSWRFTAPLRSVLLFLRGRPS